MANDLLLILKEAGLVGYILLFLFVLEGGICLYRIYVIIFEYSHWENYLLHQFSQLDGDKKMTLKFLEDEEKSFYYFNLPFFRFLSLLKQIGQIAPLLGMLGTVLGVILSLKSLNMNNNSGLLLGLSRSLSTTVMGIIISVIAIVSHQVFFYRHKLFVKRVKQKFLYGK